MTNQNKPNGTAPANSQERQEQKPQVTKLPKMEMYAVLALELSKQILEKLEQVEESVAILARQKARELDPDKPKDDKPR